MTGNSGDKFVCFHIGLPKTGTTFIQQSIFKKSRNIISYYNRIMINDFFKKNTGMNLRNIFRNSPEIWKDQTYYSAFDKLIEKFIQSSKKLCLISDENFSVNSNFFDLENPDDLEPDKLISHLKTLNERAINSGISGIKILFMTRERSSWLASRYAQSGPKFKNPKQEDFEDRIIQILEKPNLTGTKYEWLDHKRVLKKFDEAFGRNFRAISFEIFKEDRDVFIEDLNQFFDAKLEYESNKNAIKSRKGHKGQWEVAGHSDIYIELTDKLSVLINDKFTK